MKFSQFGQIIRDDIFAIPNISKAEHFKGMISLPKAITVFGVVGFVFLPHKTNTILVDGHTYFYLWENF